MGPCMLVPISVNSSGKASPLRAPERAIRTLARSREEARAYAPALVEHQAHVVGFSVRRESVEKARNLVPDRVAVPIRRL